MNGGQPGCLHQFHANEKGLRGTAQLQPLAPRCRGRDHCARLPASGTQSRSKAGHAVGPPTALVPEAGRDSTHRRDALTGEGLPHRNRQSVPASRARPTTTATCRWSSDLSFDAGPFVGRLRRVGVLNGITAKYATLRNRVSAAHRGILMSREVSGGGLAHLGHTPSTSGCPPEKPPLGR